MVTTNSVSSCNEIKMTCEHPSCTSTVGNDYVRKKQIAGWKDEPIFLCDLHSEGYELITQKTNQ
jgi:hypothetical protein